MPARPPPLRSLRSLGWLLPALAIAAPLGCTLITKVDDNKIPPPSWATGSSASSSSGEGGQAGQGGQGGEAGQGGAGQAGAGGEGGTSVPCMSDAECPGIAGQCGGPRCFADGLCGTDNEPLGAPCNENGGAACDGKGHCIECTENAHCPSGKCGPDRKCLPPTCSDQIKNGDETDIDCGGSCVADCLTGSGCTIDADCLSTSCVGSVCAPSCVDGEPNGDETDTDCGGPVCKSCALGASCVVDGDCSSGLCALGICSALPTCSDGAKNGDETDADCGGLSCPKCGNGLGCKVGPDCVSGACMNGVCNAPTCNDGVLNGTETDTDCGGMGCPLYQCLPGKVCKINSDCWSKKCEGPLGNQVCGDASCFDGIQNGDESDFDCGGSCAQKCPPGYGCSVDGDCVGGLCDTMLKLCAPTCTDGVQNGTETDPDCGGLCPLRCPIGGHCMVSSDCVPGAVCNLGHCF